MRFKSSYCFRLVKTALRHSFGRSDTIASFAGLVFGAAKHYFPEMQFIMNIEAWQILLWVFVALIIARFLLAPYWMYKEIEKERDSLLNATQKNGVVVLTEPPRLIIQIDNSDFGLSGDSGYPPVTSDERRANWIRLGIVFDCNVFIETLELVISGKAPIPAFEWEAGHAAYYHYFQIPDWVKSEEKRTIQIVAFANGVKWGSPEMSVSFPAW